MSLWKILFRGSPYADLERAAKEGDRDKVQWLLERCTDARVIRNAIEFANKGRWHAVSKDLQAALDKLTGSKPASEEQLP